MRKPDAQSVLLIKRGLRANLSLNDIASLLGCGVGTVSRWLKSPELRQMAKSIPVLSKLELIEAMQTNAIENNNATVQKFLAKNWTDLKDEKETSDTNINISVSYEEAKKIEHKPIIDVNTIESKEMTLLDVVNGKDDG